MQVNGARSVVCVIATLGSERREARPGDDPPDLLPFLAPCRAGPEARALLRRSGRAERCYLLMALPTSVTSSPTFRRALPRFS
jgi:hypothetical protein